MSLSLDSCPICSNERQNIHETDSGEYLEVKCSRCGPFNITRKATGIIRRSPELKPKLSAWIRDKLESGNHPPEITSQTFDSIVSVLPSYSVEEKLLLLLKALERRSNFPSKEVTLNSTYDFPLAWAEAPQEFEYYLHTLIDREIIRHQAPRTLQNSPEFIVVITAFGWKFLGENSRSRTISNQAFVAMSFSEKLKPAWEKGISPALTRALFRPYRVDATPHLDRIDVKIMTEIKNSRFLVADVTQHRPGVYFEAGYALGLGLPVIWCVQEKELKKVHFDTRQYSHIVWKTEEQLSDQLFHFVAAIIGKGTALQ